MHPFLQSRAMLAATTVVLVQSLLLGWYTEVWHYIDLKVGVDSVLEPITDTIKLTYPIYINGSARDIVEKSAQLFTIFNVFNMLSIFFCLMASEAIQDKHKDLNTPSQRQPDPES